MNTRYNKHGQKQILTPCIDCGKERWVVVYKGELEHQRCPCCSNKQKRMVGEDNPAWRGGRTIDSQGYIKIKLDLSSPYLPMANTKNRYIKEHRLVMAEQLGRILSPDEFVHHINGNRADNRQENLVLVEASSHKTSYSDGFQDGYNQGYSDATAKLQEVSFTIS